MYVDRLDADQSVFFLRQLEHVKQTILKKEYDELEMKRLVPPAQDPAPFGAKKITYRSWDYVGMAKLIASYADDLPNVSLNSTEQSVSTVEYGNSCQWSFFEIAAAALANLPLKTVLMQAARDTLEEQLDRTLAYGEPVTGLTGFFNNPFVPTSSVATVGGDTTWADKAAAGADGYEAIYMDVISAREAIITNSRGRHRPNTLVIPFGAEMVLDRSYNNQGLINTVRNRLQGSIPGLQIIPSFRARAADSGGVLSSDMFVLYNRSPDVLSYEEPLPFTTMPPQDRNLAQVVNCVASTGGVQFLRPLAAVYRTGI